MATTYPEYESVGIVDGYKLLSTLQDELAQIELDLKNGYTRNLKSDDVDLRGKKQDLAQFSDLRNSFIAKQKDIIARQSALSATLQKKAKAYVPLTGPELAVTKEEKRIVGLILGKPSAASTDGTAQTAKAVIGPKGVVGPQLSDITTVAPSGSDIPVVTTAPTGGGSGGGVSAPVKPKGVSPDAWKDVLRQTFPSYTNEWLSDNASTHFGPDLIGLMIEASKPNGKYQGLTTQEGKDAYALALRQTIYYTTTETNARNFDQQTTADKESLVRKKKLDIVDAYGDLGFDDATLTALATDAARKGVTGLGLKQAVYSGTFKQQTAQPALARRALEGADADLIRQNARAYGYAVSDAEVQAALTGGMYNGVAVSSESILQKAQKAAKGAYGHLSDQIDAGLSLSDIFENYKRYAANVLELDESQIDFTKDPKWQSAFGTKESGQMGLGDWVTKLKSDESFGWQYTKQANQQATDVGLTLARAFGKVK